MFYDGSSDIKILKCFILLGNFNSASPITVITALIAFELRSWMSCAKTTFPKASPLVLLLCDGSIIQ